MDELLLSTLTSPYRTSTDGLLLTILIDEPFTTLQTDGLLPTILIDELSPQHRLTSSYYLRLTSPPLHFRQMGSSPQFSLTSSLLNTDGRALTIYVDEPFTALQTDGLLPILTSSPLNSDGRAPTICIDELSPQHRCTCSYYLRLTSPPLHFKQTGSFLQLLLTSPLLHSKQMGSFSQFLFTSPLLHFKQTGSFLQFLLTSSPLNTDGRALTIYD